MTRPSLAKVPLTVLSFSFLAVSGTLLYTSRQKENLMTRVTVDAAVERELLRAAVIAEICDSSGRVIGYFRPRQVPQHLLDLADVPVDQLLDRGRLQSGRPLSEVVSACEAATDGDSG